MSVHAADHKPISPAEKDAARKYLEHDHAAHSLKGAPAEEANRNAQAIDEEHERARDIALTGTADELGKLPPHLRAHQLRSRKQAGITTEHAARIRSSYRPRTSSRSRAGRAGARGSAAARAPRAPRAPRVNVAIKNTIPGAAPLVNAATGSSLGSLAGQVFLWGMGLSIFYLLLTHPAGPTGLATGAANVTRALVGVNVDPLNPRGAIHAAPLKGKP